MQIADVPTLRYTHFVQCQIDQTAGLVESGRSYALVLSDAMLRTLKDASNGVLVTDISPISECMAEVSESLLDSDSNASCQPPVDSALEMLDQ